MDVRIRFPELLAARGYSPYRLAKESGGRISMSQAYRLHRSEGRADYIETKALAAICDVLGVRDLNELFSRDDEEPASAERAPAAKRKAKR